MTRDVCSDVRYNFVPTVPGARASIGHDALAQSMFKGILDALANGMPVRALTAVRTNGEMMKADVAVAECASAVAKWREKAERALDLTLTLEGDAARAVGERYNEYSASLALAEDALQAANSDRDAKAAALRSTIRTATAGDLLAFVQSIRDPHKVDSRDAIRELVSGLTVTTTQFLQDGVPRTLLEWTGQLTFSQDGHEYAIPFSGSEQLAEVRGRRTPKERGLAFLTGMPVRNSPSLGESKQWPRPEEALEILNSAGLSASQSWLLQISDPILLKLHLAHAGLDPDGRTLAQLCNSAEVRRVFGESNGIMRAVMRSAERVQRHRQPTWWVLVSRHESEALIATAQGAESVASRKGWSTVGWEEVSAGHRRPTQCPACSGRARARLHLPEVTGLVCLECRRDDAGVSWPADQFAHYTAHGDAWQAAAIDIGLTLASHTQSGRIRVRLLPNEIKEAFRQDYLNGDTYQRLLNKYSLTNGHEIRYLAEELGISR